MVQAFFFLIIIILKPAVILMAGVSSFRLFLKAFISAFWVIILSFRSTTCSIKRQTLSRSLAILSLTSRIRAFTITPRFIARTRAWALSLDTTIWAMESGLTIRARSPPRYTPPWRIILDRYQNSHWSINKGALLSEKNISSVAVLNTFLTIAKLFRGTAEFPSPANPRGRALLKFLVLSAMVPLIGYSITFPSG